MHITYTEMQIVENFDKIKPLFDKYNEKLIEDENVFYRFICNKDVFILILDDVAFAVYELVKNPLTKQLHCNIWQMYAPARGKELSELVEKEAIEKGANVLGFWTNEPEKFKRLCALYKTGLGENISYFKKELK